MFHFSRGFTALSRASARGLICESISANGSFLGSLFISSTDLKNCFVLGFQTETVKFTILRKS